MQVTHYDEEEETNKADEDKTDSSLQADARQLAEQLKHLRTLEDE